MKEAEIRKTPQLERGASRRATPRELDLALLEFVEALAIANARRDHLILSGLAATSDLDVANIDHTNEINKNEARSDLRSVLDRASE